MLPLWHHRLTGLVDQCSHPVQTVIGAGHVVGHVRKAALRVVAREPLGRGDRCLTAHHQRLDPCHAGRQEFLGAGPGGNQALDERGRLGIGLFGPLHVGQCCLRLTGIKQLGGEFDMLDRRVEPVVGIGSWLGEQPALGTAASDRFSQLVGVAGSLLPAVVSGLERIQPRTQGFDRCPGLVEAAAGCDGIALDLLAKAGAAPGDLGQRRLKHGV